MSKILKYILFRTVLIVIVSHAIISHPHSDELTEEKHFELHQKSNSIIGIIRLAFHENNDESLDYLVFTQFENTKKFDNSSHKLFPSLINEKFIIEEKLIEKKLKFPLFRLETSLLIKLNTPRGPPSRLYNQSKKYIA